MKRIAFIVLFLALSSGVAWGNWTQPSAGGSSGSSVGACQTASSLGFHLNGTDETALLNSTLLSFYNAGGGCLAIDCGKALRADGQIVLPNAGTVTYGMPPYSITSLTSSGTTATATIATSGSGEVSNFTSALAGVPVLIAGASPSGYNGPVTITGISGNTFTYTVSSGLSTPATGTITFTGLGYPWLQPPMRLTSFCGGPGNYSDAIDCSNAQLYGVSGSSCMGSNMSAMRPGAVLDLRYRGSGLTAYQGGPKLLTLGSGRVEIDHITITTGGSDCATFFMSTLSGVNLHDNTWIGYRASGQSFGCNDDIQLGGTNNSTAPLTNTVSDRYTGYGSEIYNNFFSRSRQLISTQSTVNALHVHHNTNDQSCGYTSGYYQAPYNLGGLNGSDISFNLVETYGYANGLYLSGAASNTFIGNEFWDSSTAFHYCSDPSSTNNYFVDLSYPASLVGCPYIWLASNANTVVTQGQVLAPRIAFPDGTYMTTGYNNTGSPGSSVYVDVFGGNDASTACSQTYPCRTVAKAYSRAPSATAAYVRVASGGSYIALPVPSTGWSSVQALYLFNEGSGTVLHDVANGFNITLPASNSPTWGTGGLRFTASSSQYIDVNPWSNVAGLTGSMTQPLTQIFVHNAASHPSAWSCLFDWDGNNSGVGVMRLQLTNNGYIDMYAGGTDTTTSLADTTGTAQAVTAVWNGASSLAYANSTAASQNPFNPGSNNAGSSFNLGANSANHASPYDGTMSMFMVVNAAATATDITSTLYPWVKSLMSTYHNITLP